MVKISLEEAIERLQKDEQVMMQKPSGSICIVNKNSMFTADMLHTSTFYVKDSEEITISKYDYDKLVEKADFLDCLEACGVDNWHGYSDAHEMMEEEEEEF